MRAECREEYIRKKQEPKELRVDIINGVPCLWEAGGGMTNTGRSTIIAGPKGERKKALIVKTAGHLAGREHAAIPIEKEDYLIEVYRHRDEISIWISRVLEVEQKIVRVSEVYWKERGEWFPEPPPQELQEAIKAAVEKACCYHCRSPHFLL
ncbi:MAG: hypothetical protein QXR87_06840 [Candidatus Hadarchaeales archaeon]